MSKRGRSKKKPNNVPQDFPASESQPSTSRVAKKLKTGTKDLYTNLSELEYIDLLSDSDFEEETDASDSNYSEDFQEESDNSLCEADDAFLFPNPTSSNSSVDECSITEQDFIWQTNKSEKRIIPFSKDSGLQLIPPDNSPADYFFLLANYRFFDLLIGEINRQAVSPLKTNKSRKNGWKEVSREDIEVFLGLLYLSGSIKTPTFAHLWMKNDLYNIPAFPNAMSKNKFYSILSYLNFAKNSDDRDLSQTLHEMRPLLDHFNDIMKEAYVPGRELVLSEFTPPLEKRAKLCGLKHYALTEPDGMVLQSVFHCGVRGFDVRGSKLSERVALTLLSDYMNCGHSVCFGKFFNSVSLSTFLLENKTYSTGILKENRKDNPPHVINKDLERGEVESSYTSDGICVLKWRDNKDTYLVSSEYSADKISKKSKNKSKMPFALYMFNKYTKRKDISIPYYACEIKRMGWCTRIAIVIFHLIMNNAYLLFRKYADSEMRLIQFRDSVIETLLYKNRPRLTIPSLVPTTAYGIHFPEVSTSKSEGGKKRKRCRVCFTKGIRKMTPYFCPQCLDKPGLCLNPCFKQYHNYV